MSDETTLLPCPFCVGESFVRIDTSLRLTQSRYRVGCDKDPSCHGWYGHSRYYATEAEAIAAWNTRTTHGTLTAEQVREAVEGHGNIMNNRLYEDWQAVANELGGRGCEIIGSSTNNLMYPDYMTKWYELSCGHSVTLKGSEPPRFCPRCGKAVKR